MTRKTISRKPKRNATKRIKKGGWKIGKNYSENRTYSRTERKRLRGLSRSERSQFRTI